MKVTKHIEQLLRQGRKPRELVQLGFPKSVVTRVHRQLDEDKAASQKKVPDRAPQAETHVQTPPESPEKIATILQKLQSMANDMQGIDGFIQALSEVTMVIAAAREHGTYKREDCLYQKGGVCTFWIWGAQDEIPSTAGEPVFAGEGSPDRHIKPSPYYCAACTQYLEGRIDEVEGRLSGDPLSDAQRHFTCSRCGSKGLIAAAIKCTKCGHQTWLGWHPETDAHAGKPGK